jgi:hypothetical protein
MVEKSPLRPMALRLKAPIVAQAFNHAFTEMTDWKVCPTIKEQTT